MRFEWRSRGVVAVGLIAVLAVFGFFHLPAAWAAVAFVLALGAAFEWGRLCGFGVRESAVFVGGFAALAVLGEGLAWWRGEAAHGDLFAVLTVFWISAAPWWVLRGQRRYPVLTATVGYLLLYGVWRAAVALYDNDPQLLFVSIALVCLFDTACYAVGKMMGQTPMAPAISAGKTVEGLLGGMGVTLAAGAIYGAYWYGGQAPLAVVLCTVFTFAALAMLGDLFISAMKRRAGAKDSGAIFGNHGGILDRLDSLLPALPMAALLSPWVA